MNERKPIALVTGATRGIGHGIVEELVKAGFTIAAVGTRPEGDSFNGIYIQGDISNADDRKRIVDTAIEKLGGALDTVSTYTLTDGGEVLERTIIIIKKVKNTSELYPRNNSQISKKPL